MSGPEADSLCLAIKRQSGELFGTTDLVFLPTLSVQNALPCDLKIKRGKRFSNQEQLHQRLQNHKEEKTYFLVQKSEQKDFYVFEGTGDSKNEITMRVQVDGFLLSYKIRLNQRNVQDCNLEIQDRFDNKLTLGMRVQPNRAGYQVTIYAHAVVMLETVRLLNNNSIRVYYEAESIRQQIQAIGGRRRQMLAGQEAIDKKRFVMCNADQSICVSVKESASAKQRREASDELTASAKGNLKSDYFGAANVELQDLG